MGITTYIHKIITAVGLFFSAVFYVLYRQAKEEKQESENAALKKESEQKQAEVEILQSVAEAEVKAKEENEELIQTINSSNNLSSFNAGLDLLRK